MTDPGYPTPDPNTTPAPGVPPQTPPPSYGIPQSMPPQQPYQQPYQQAPYVPAGPPPGYASSEDKTWALIATFGAAVGNLFCGVAGFIAPLVAFLAKGSSPAVRQQAAASLNFQIPISAISLVLLIIREISAPDIFTGSGSAGIYWLTFLAGWVVAVVGIIFGILAGIKANEGNLFTYPVNLNIVK